MKSKTAYIALQLRIPTNMKGFELEKFVRDAITEQSRKIASGIVNLDGSELIKLYRDRVEVFMP